MLLIEIEAAWHFFFWVKQEAICTIAVLLWEYPVHVKQGKLRGCYVQNISEKTEKDEPSVCTIWNWNDQTR